MHIHYPLSLALFTTAGRAGSLAQDSAWLIAARAAQRPGGAIPVLATLTGRYGETAMGTTTAVAFIAVGDAAEAAAAPVGNAPTRETGQPGGRSGRLGCTPTAARCG